MQRHRRHLAAAGGDAGDGGKGVVDAVELQDGHGQPRVEPFAFAQTRIGLAQHLQYAGPVLARHGEMQTLPDQHAGAGKSSHMGRDQVVGFVQLTLLPQMRQDAAGEGCRRDLVLALERPLPRALEEPDGFSRVVGDAAVREPLERGADIAALGQGGKQRELFCFVAVTLDQCDQVRQPFPCAPDGVRTGIAKVLGGGGSAILLKLPIEIDECPPRGRHCGFQPCRALEDVRQAPRIGVEDDLRMSARVDEGLVVEAERAVVDVDQPPGPALDDDGRNGFFLEVHPEPEVGPVGGFERIEADRHERHGECDRAGTQHGDRRAHRGRQAVVPECAIEVGARPRRIECAVHAHHRLVFAGPDDRAHLHDVVARINEVVVEAEIGSRLHPGQPEELAGGAEIPVILAPKHLDFRIGREEFRHALVVVQEDEDPVDLRAQRGNRLLQRGAPLRHGRDAGIDHDVRPDERQPEGDGASPSPHFPYVRLRHIPQDALQRF